MMRVSESLPASPRLLLTSALGIVLGLFLTLLAMLYMHGANFTVGWLLGYQWPYPRDIQIESGWWLASSFTVWVILVVYLWRHGGQSIRALGVMAGPVAALWVLFSWTVSLLFYSFGVWGIGSPPTGLRWVLDGPIMRLWRDTAGWLLWRIRLQVSTATVHFIDGSSVGHTHASIIVLGLLNEAMLACVFTTLLVVGSNAGARRLLVRAKPHNNRMQATAGGLGGGISCDGRAPAAPDAER